MYLKISTWLLYYSFRESVEISRGNGAAGPLAAGHVVMLYGECRLANQERRLLRQSIIQDVALLRPSVGGLQNG